MERNLETASVRAENIANEWTVARVLWDFVDGASGLPDVDHDPFAVEPSRLYAAMIELRGVGSVSLSPFLGHLIRQGDVASDELNQYLAELPPGSQVWAQTASRPDFPRTFGSSHAPWR